MLRLVLPLCLLLSHPLLGANLDKQLAQAANRKDEALLLKLLATMESEPSKRTVGLLVKIGVEMPSRKVYAAVRKRLAGVEEKATLTALQKMLLRSKDYRTRALVLAALGDNPQDDTVSLLLPLLKHRDAKIRIQVAAALGKKPHPYSVGGLIDILPRADKIAGEFSATIRRSLYRLTHRSFASHKDWEKWWSFEKDRWKPPVEGSTGKTELKFLNPPGDFPTFFGVEIFSLRVVFVIDISGSMTEPVRGFTISRVDLVKGELIKAIQTMRPKTRFTIITFNSQITSYSTQLVEATRQHKEKAIGFVRSLTPDAETWTQDALQQAFAVEGANTIVLLSDGSPFKNGRFQNKKAILDWVELTNRFRNATIHTIGFPEAYFQFLQSMARTSGGKYHSATPPERFRKRPTE